MRKLIEYLRPFFGRMTWGLFIKFSGTITDLLIPWILSYIIDDIIPLEDVRMIFFWGLIMLICSAVAVSANIIANRMASKVAMKVTEKLRHDLFSKITYLSSSQIDDVGIPSLTSRLTTDTYNVHNMIGRLQRFGVRAPILLIGGIIITLTLEPVLTLVLLAILPFITVLIFYISKKGIPLYTKLQEKVDVLVRIVRENITGVRIIKALSKTDYEHKRFNKSNQDTVDAEVKAGRMMALTNPLMNLFLNIGLTLVILLGAYRVNSGMTQPGKIIAFLTYFTIILNAMLGITRIFVTVSRGTASAERIAVILDMPKELEVEAEDYIPSDYHITFDKVSFSYHKKDYNLKDISFSLKQGETLGIIGATGCGKSTLINLLMRLYDVDEGVIRINGSNIKSIPPDELYQKFGIVFQHDILFADSIANNIDFGRGLPIEKIMNSAIFSQAAEFIEDLSEGYDYPLAIKGSNLSGGQKQRLLISRALAGEPEILILDDSSSALDYRTDAKLRGELAKNFEDTTSIIIAQRISSIMKADHIMVLDEGEIIGYGSHEELMKTCVVYREIGESQMGGKALAI